MAREANGRAALAGEDAHVTVDHLWLKPHLTTPHRRNLRRAAIVRAARKREAAAKVVAPSPVVLRRMPRP